VISFHFAATASGSMSLSFGKTTLFVRMGEHCELTGVPVSSLPSQLSGVTTEDFVEGSSVLALFGSEITNDGCDEVRRHGIHEVPIVNMVPTAALTATYLGQTVAVIAVPALGAIQLAWIPARPPSIASVLVKPMMADLAVE
jgi:hypothetical protein